MNVRKTLGTITLASLIGLAGCSEKGKEVSYKEGTFRGYDIIIREGVLGKEIQINRDISKDSYLYARDRDGNGVVDEIFLWSIPKGSPIEKYANPDSLEVAYNEVKNQGE